MQYFSSFAKFALLMGLTFFLFNEKLKQPKIFILHSYDDDYLWAKQVNKGIFDVLNKNNSYNIKWHYMNTKNYPSLSFRQRAGIWARQQIADFKPDILLAIDDDAQAFVSKFYVDAPGITIVYAGVSGEAGDYGFDLSQNTTGIYERLPLNATKDFMKLLSSSNEEKIIHIGDSSLTVKNYEKNIFNFNWSPFYFIDSVVVETFDEWKNAVIQAQKRANFIYITNYRKIYTDKTFLKFENPENIIAWTMIHSKVPVIGSNSLFVKDGGTMAIATSPFEQGRVAMEMIEKLIEGKPIKNIKPEQSQEFLVVLKDKTDENFPAIYQSFAKVMNFNRGKD